MKKVISDATIKLNLYCYIQTNVFLFFNECYFQYVGDVMLRGHKSAKWRHKFKVYNKVNTYILYTTKSKPVKPLRYEMMGYDTLLSSYYDHYVLDYEMFERWHFNYTKLQIPTGTWDVPK
jgi:hypothetical protein